MGMRPRMGNRPRRVVYPTQHNCVQCCSESEVEHIHPSHTTIMNHHLVKNKHVFPHSTSVQNTWNEVDVYGGSFEVPNTGPAAMGPGSMMGPGNQVAGAMAPGQNPGGMPGRRPWTQQNKWC
ncbi:spore coat protein [Lentibacillus saliphilus]|uniref:spore coat protein n=1 Tax=Lentibacillus saliphilus TaxID=2737028 RepID=UPI001C2FEDDC|nr:spore coat protein [Lentibacillus saliphilus]